METVVINVVSEYNNGLVKTRLMKYALTTGEVYPRTSRFSDQRDTVRELRKSEAATSQRAEDNKKSMSTLQKKIKITLMMQELFKKLSFIIGSDRNHNQTDHFRSKSCF